MDKIHIILIIVCLVLASVLAYFMFKKEKECPPCAACPSFPPSNFLGVKGKWNQDFKDTQNPVPGNDKCSQCIVDKSESMLTPYEYLTANGDTKKMVLKNCDICKNMQK